MTDQSPFNLPESALPVPEPSRQIMARQWLQLAQPGTWWTGQQKVAIVATARAERRRQSLGDPDSIADSIADSINEPTRQAAGTVAARAGTITQATVEDWFAQGLDPLAYVELVGLVARTTAIDTAVIGLGGPLEPLPDPAGGEPSQVVLASAKRRSAWVPMVGGAGATTALSAIPAEDRAQEELHGALYLTYQEMGSFTINKGLSRSQMELVASRTSLHNDCYF